MPIAPEVWKACFNLPEQPNTNLAPHAGARRVIMDVITTQVCSFHGRTVKDAALTDSTVRGRFSQLGEPAAVMPATSSAEAILVSR